MACSISASDWRPRPLVAGEPDDARAERREALGGGPAQTGGHAGDDHRAPGDVPEVAVVPARLKLLEAEPAEVELVGCAGGRRHGRFGGLAGRIRDALSHSWLRLSQGGHLTELRAGPADSHSACCSTRCGSARYGLDRLRAVPVRAATLTDLPGIAKVSLANQQPDGADAAYMADLIANGTVLVATHNGRLVGWGATRPHDLGIFITDLFVDPGEHAHGVGSALLAELPAEQSTGSACFTFSSRHTAAQRAYTHIGPGACCTSPDQAGSVIEPDAHPDVPRLPASGHAEIDYDVAMSRGVTLPTDSAIFPAAGDRQRTPPTPWTPTRSVEPERVYLIRSLAHDPDEATCDRIR